MSARGNLARLDEQVGNLPAAQHQWMQIAVIGREIGQPEAVREAESELGRWGIVIPRQEAE